MFDFNNYSSTSKYYDHSNTLVGRMKDETGGVAFKEFAGLQPKVYSFWVDDSKHEKTEDVNKPSLYS